MFHFAVQVAKSFPPSATPIVDNFSCLPRKRLTHIYATKNQIPRYVVKHIFAHFRLFVLRLDKEWSTLHSLIVHAHQTFSTPTNAKPRIRCDERFSFFSRRGAEFAEASRYALAAIRLN